MPHKKLQIEYLPPNELQEYQRQLRTTPKSQTQKAQRLLEKCGPVIPVVVDKNNVAVIGSVFLTAACALNLDSIPIVRLNHLDEEQIRVLRIAHERIIEDAAWNPKALAEEFQELQVLIPEIDLTLTGFEIEEINILLDVLPNADIDEAVPETLNGPAVTQPGDLYRIGDHFLLCGNSLEDESFQRLMAGEVANACFVDMPFNVAVDGHVGNSGKTKHREFTMASGEMKPDEFTEFLTTAHQRIADHTAPGAVIYSCMDWRHLFEILIACQSVGLIQLNTCVWVKDNGGMGSFYRSRHELVLVFKNGTAKHVNNVQLGKNGRYRTNVWEYPGVNSFGNGRMEELKMHPTVKPVAMVVDAIKDCSRRGDIILDPFGGSGTTLIAAEKTERSARLIEIDPLYCDVTIRRWQDLTGEHAVHAETGIKFNDMKMNKGEK